MYFFVSGQCRLKISTKHPFENKLKMIGKLHMQCALFVFLYGHVCPNVKERNDPS